MAENTQTVFLKKTQNRISSPKQLTDYPLTLTPKNIGGRPENYTDAPDKQPGPVSAELDRMATVIDALVGAEPFALIPALMKK